MTVLVTGGAGFIGRPLVHALAERGETVVSFDRALPGDGKPTPKSVTDIAGDITDGTLVGSILREHRITKVVHTAAIVGVAASVGSVGPSVQVNIAGSVGLFEAIVRVGGVTRLVDLSSEETYGDFAVDPITEDTPGRPISPYGITKLSVELLGNYFADHHALPYVAARFCWVYGPNFPRTRLPSPWLDDIANGRQSALARGGDQRIDFTYVDDVLHGLLLILDAEVLGHRAYNIATGTATSVRDLAAILHKMRPEWSVDLGGGNLEQSPGVLAATKGALDISRARVELGYEPRFSLADGLALTLASVEASNTNERV